VSVAPYLNFYDGGPKSETVHVLRILHGRRDITPGLISTGRER
jgi:plasmid stabilization system protein ParE